MLNGQKISIDISLQRIHKSYQKSTIRCSTSQNIRAMQIKTTVRDHLRPVRMAVMKQCANNKVCRGCGEKGPFLLQCWWECKLVESLWRTVWRLFKKLKIELPCDLAIPLLGIFPEKSQCS